MSIRVLLIDEHETRANTLRELLRASGVSDVIHMHGTAYLIDKVMQTRPDIVLIEMESPNRDVLEQLMSLRNQQPHPVVMFTQDPDAQCIRAAVESGVSAYIVDGIHAAQVKPAIDLAMATFRRFQQMQQDLSKAQRSLAQHKKIDRAKGILMSQKNLSEEDAYRALRRLAMNRKRKLIDVAEDIIAMSTMIG